MATKICVTRKFKQTTYFTNNWLIKVEVVLKQKKLISVRF